MSKPCAFQANSLRQVLLHGSGADTRVCRVETRLDLLRAARAPRRVSALQTRVSALQGYATLFRRLSVATGFRVVIRNSASALIETGVPLLLHCWRGSR